MDKKAPLDYTFISNVLTIITFVAFCIVYTKIILNTKLFDYFMFILKLEIPIVGYIIAFSFFSPTLIGIISFFKLIVFVGHETYEALISIVSKKPIARGYYIFFYISRFIGILMFIFVMSIFTAAQSDSFISENIVKINHYIDIFFENSIAFFL